MGKIWVFTDPHFGHDEFVTEGLRPKGFDEKMLANIGNYVSPSDTLICLGDLCWKDDALWHERLCFIPCKRWLCLGNHDKRSDNWYGDHGWHFVGESFTKVMFGKRILFSHYPMAIPEGVDINLHGHFHDYGLEKVKDKEPELYALLTPKHKLVSMEALKYQPIKLQRLVEEL